MDYSKNIKTEIKKAKISIEEKIFADLMLLGWKDTDAYIAAFGYNITLSDSYIKSQMRSVINNPDFTKYMEVSGRKNERREMREENDDDIYMEEALSMSTKEETLKDLIIAKSKMKRGSKEWLDTTKLIADLQQMKKDIVEEEDTTVHYYLPLTCNRCSLYLANKKKNNNTH